MIKTVRNRVSKTDPASNYSEACCSRCETPCVESRQPGQTGPKGCDAAYEIALKTPGWAERLTPIAAGAVG